MEPGSKKLTKFCCGTRTVNKPVGNRLQDSINKKIIKIDNKNVLFFRKYPLSLNLNFYLKDQETLFS